MSKCYKCSYIARGECNYDSEWAVYARTEKGAIKKAKRTIACMNQPGGSNTKYTLVSIVREVYSNTDEE